MNTPDSIQRLKEVAYYKTGGSFDRLYVPTSVEDLSDVVRETRANGGQILVLGGGTNSLVMDHHWDGMVVIFQQMNEIQFNQNKITVGAGVENTQFALAARDQGLSGAAWMNRLPGQLGGTVRMNARCYGGEISQIVSEVTTVTANGDIKVYTDSSVFRGYKDTEFMDNGDIIAQVKIELAPGQQDEIGKEMNIYEQDRISKGQFDFPTCGCVFKNNYDVGVPSGMLLDASGVKNLGSDVVQINPHHANFVYNKGASSQEILQVTFEMRELVYDRFGVWLEYEMEILGRPSPDEVKQLTEKRAQAFRDEELAPLREAFHNRR